MAAPELLSPVKSTFKVRDANTLRGKEVTLGEDKNEDASIGMSSTQTKLHEIKCKGGRVKIIDTPGIGDTR